MSEETPQFHQINRPLFESHIIKIILKNILTFCRPDFVEKVNIFPPQDMHKGTSKILQRIARHKSLDKTKVEGKLLLHRFMEFSTRFVYVEVHRIMAMIMKVAYFSDNSNELIFCEMKVFNSYTGCFCKF